MLVAAAALPAAAAAAPRVYAIHFDSEVNPVTQDWLNNKLDHAASSHYDAAVILIDTPGGLSDSMRKIVQKELTVGVPVIVYVSPPGARAASAGVCTVNPSFWALAMEALPGCNPTRTDTPLSRRFSACAWPCDP